MKKSISAILAIIGGLLTIAFLVWAFSQHGTVGLYQVNGFLRSFFIGLGVLALVLLLLAFAIWWLKSRGKALSVRWLSVVAIILAIPGILIPAAGFSYLGGVFSPGMGETPPRLLMVDGTGAHEVPDIALAFTTEDATRNTVTWGLENDMIALNEDAPSKQHVFMLRDLQPDSIYFYRVNSGPLTSFKTPATDGTLHFAIGSDSHMGAETSRQDLTAKMLQEISDPASGFDMFFFLGDLVEYGFEKELWLQELDAFSGVTSTMPVRFAAGNHDTLFSGFGRYLDYCYPEGADTKTGSRLWYRMDIGDVHFFVLDVEWSTECFTSEQAEWLQAELDSVPDDDWKIVMSHSFYYSSGVEANGWDWYDNHETIEQITPLFNEYGVDLVFSGHNHRLELLENSGVLYVVCGAFGGLPEPEATYISPSNVWGGSGGYGFMDVTLDKEQCTLVFRDSDFASLKTYVLNKS